MPSTVRLHRILTASPEKLYRAFLEPDALAKWLPPNGFTCTVHHLDPSEGVGAVVMANGSMSSQQSNEGVIRQKMVEEDVVDCVDCVTLGNRGAADAS